MNKIILKLGKIITTIVFAAYIIGILIAIVLMPIILVQHVSEKVASFFKGNEDLLISKDYRKTIDTWQASNHTSFNYDKLMTCMYIIDENDKINALYRCANMFDGNGKFNNPLIDVSEYEIYGIYKNGIEEWEGSVDESLFEDIRLPNLYQKEHYRKVTHTKETTNATEEVEEEWILDYVESNAYVDRCDEHKPESACLLIRPERFVFPYQPPQADFNAEERYGYQIHDDENNIGLEFINYIDGNGSGAVQLFTNSELTERTENTATFRSTRKGFEFFIRYENINCNAEYGKELEVQQEIGIATGKVKIFLYRIEEGVQKYFNPMILMGQSTGATGGITEYASADEIPAELSLLDFLLPFPEVKITCDYNRCYPGHTGVDVQPKNSNGLGENIRAGVSGKVVMNGYNDISGYHVMIQDNVSGIFIKYNHLQTQSNLAVGSYVERGNTIGQEGQTGWATGPHVHVQFQRTMSRSTVIDPRIAARNIYQ